MEDSIYPLPLPGWEDLSTWGGDTGMGSLYAQLTRNGSSDDDGPDIWITPRSTRPSRTWTSSLV